MLKIKHSRRDNSWVVYNPDNFALHTHTRHKRIALKLRYLAEHHMIPDSRDARFVESLMRLTKNKTYLRQLMAYRMALDKSEDETLNGQILGGQLHT